MKKRLLKDLLVLGLLIAVIFIICLFLPERIPVHFDAQGKADIVMNKYFLLFFAIIPYSTYWKFIRGKGDT